MVVALDCGTRTGWAITADLRPPEHGVEEFTLERGESPGMRFRRFRLWLEQCLDLEWGDLVIFEQAHHRGGAATELCVGMTTRVMEFAASRYADYKAVHSGTLKRHITGKGNANKGAVIEAVNRRFNLQVTDDNEADALAMIAWYQDGMPEKARKKRKAVGGSDG